MKMTMKAEQKVRREETKAGLLVALGWNLVKTCHSRHCIVAWDGTRMQKAARYNCASNVKRRDFKMGGGRNPVLQRPHKTPSRSGEHAPTLVDWQDAGSSQPKPDGSSMNGSTSFRGLDLSA